MHILLVNDDGIQSIGIRALCEAALRRVNALFQLENPDGGVLGDLEFVTLLSPPGQMPLLAVMNTG